MTTFSPSKARYLLATTGVCLLLMGAGCQSTTESTRSDGTVATSSSSTQTASLCDHPYYPLKPGYSVAFNNRYAGGSGTSTMSVVDGADDHTNVQIRFSSGLSSTQSFNCTDGDLRATGYVDLASSAAGQPITMETQRVEGVLIPRAVAVGSDWNTKFYVVIHTQDPRLQQAGLGDMNGTVEAHHRVLAEESVTVPAGTFTALKVQTETMLQFSGTNGPLGMPGDSTIKTTEWWVKGKGLVKTVGGLDGSVISEATAINVP